MKKAPLVILTLIFSNFIIESFGQNVTVGSVESKKEEKKSVGVTNQSNASNSTKTGIATGSSGLLEERDGVELRYSYTPQKSKTCTEYIDKTKYTIHYFKLTVTLYNGSGKTVTIDNAMVHSETDLNTLNSGLPCADIPARNTAIVFVSIKLQPGESKVMYGSDWVRWNQMPTPRYKLDNIYFEKDKAILPEKKEIIQESNNQTAAAQMAEWKRRNDQLQNELDNAKNTSMEVFQRAVSEGRKESGALAESIIAGGSQISDPTGSLVYTGVGLGLALIKSIGEKKTEKLEKEAQIQSEQDRKLIIYKTKNKFIEDVLNLNNYTTQDFYNSKRYAVAFIFPKTWTGEVQQIYFSPTFNIPMYSDSTFPHRAIVEKAFSKIIDVINFEDYNLYALYPIFNIEKFDSEFIKKMGSGTLIYLEANILNLTKQPFEETDHKTNSNSTDFWNIK